MGYAAPGRGEFERRVESLFLTLIFGIRQLLAANEGRSRKDGIFYMAKSNRSGVWQRTMVIVGFVLVLGFGAVITNLVRLQLVNGETLKTDAVDQSLQSTQLTPSRGTIYDATGTKVLAQSASVWTVALEPNYIDEGDDVKIAKGLSEILGLDYDDVLKKRSRTATLSMSSARWRPRCAMRSCSISRTKRSAAASR